jgi:predicted AAA+ superfamily ATPase
VSLERPDIRSQVLEDPNRFLKTFKEGIILDEIQKTPELFSYIQAFADESGEMGRFILTGSENFLLSDKISQSLSGRVRIFRLLPFSYLELEKTGYLRDEADFYLFNGMYPPIYDRGLDSSGWYQNYIETYLERDVRNIKNISNLRIFQKFLSLCAGRIGQLLNYNSLASDCGISHNTAREWISILEASYIIFTLQPYHNNFTKRIVKQPKLYFYDTGLVCSILGIPDISQVSNHHMRGALFEAFIISEYIKFRFNNGLKNNSYFWRDRYGNEIDLLIDKGELYPVEIKSGETINSDFFKGLEYWTKISGELPDKNVLIYGGTNEQIRNNGKIFGWNLIRKWLDQFILNGYH